MNKTNISWTDYTWNPVSGCTKVSDGCLHCYAESLCKRWGRSFEVKLHPEKLKEVKKIPAGSKVFVNSMSDLFHPDVPTQFINQVIDAIRSRPDVIFQVLTKRPEQLRLRLAHVWQILPENMWLGVSVESNKYLDRIKILQEISGPYFIFKGLKFISFEPLLESIDIFSLNLKDISWIVVGAESGKNRRPFNEQWARNIRDKCEIYSIPFFYKQGSDFKPGKNDILDGKIYKQFPLYELNGENK